MSTVITEIAQDLSRPVLIKGAAIVTMDARLSELLTGDILIEGGLIREIAPHIDAPNASVIEARRMIAIPGFVDSHRHLWPGLMRNAMSDYSLSDYFPLVLGKLGPAHTPSDVYASTLISALGTLNAGVTTVLDWAHIQNSPEHTDAGIQALRESGIRAVFAYGMPAVPIGTVLDSRQKYPDDILRLAKDEFASKDQLLTLALAANSPEHAPYDVTKYAWNKGREAGVRITAHTGLVEFGMRDQIERFGREGMLGPDLTLVHCNLLSETEWKMVADTGTTVSISAHIEMVMGHGPPPTQTALDLGILPSLSVDAEIAVPGDFFTHMRATLAAQRNDAFRRRYGGDPAAPKLLSVRDVMKMATVAGAHANGLSHKVGSLEVGKQADIVLLDAANVNVAPINDLVGSIVTGMDVSNVDTVLVAGRVMKRGGKLLGVDLPALYEKVYSARDGLFERAGVPCGCPRHF
jgi:5-methylthioadenosine/S-adenosylhomocysteine deaminase